MKKVKCERCGRIRDLFKYTFFDEPKTLKRVKYDVTGNPQFTIQSTQIDESRGLCEECHKKTDNYGMKGLKKKNYAINK